jgi:hypothetical protein
MAKESKKKVNLPKTKGNEEMPITSDEKELENSKSSSETKKKESLASKVKDISSKRINLEKKPVPEVLTQNEGIKYYFYFMYVFVFLNLLMAINANIFDFTYWLNLNGFFYNNQPLVPADLFLLFKLNLFSFFIALLGIILRVFVATGLAILAFDDNQNAWLRIITVPAIAFIIFGIQLIGP